ncbi:ankyrin repeat-containing protein ITN1-like [Carica papaya]|uniref:ankyrin repeat-containing protein ITN1-like n=1 Tax=Carica papaya TaxID=3649 RepID=UPI000B8CCDEA|nr:ankyrin repeat-containing protein ITN1-like [Carica papaya]
MERRLHEAAMEGNVISLVNLLQEDPLALDRLLATCHTETPLHIASMLGHVRFVTELVARKPELATEPDIRRSTPLHLAAARGNFDVAKVLLTAAGSEICLATDGDGRTPLHVAAVKGHVGIVRELAAARPDAARVLLDRGETILHACVRFGQVDAMKVVAKVVDGEFVNVKDRVSGNTALHLAVAHRQTEAINFLISGTAIDVNAVNAQGLTALDILVQTRRNRKDKDIAESLKHAGAVTCATNESPLSVHDEPEVISSTIDMADEDVYTFSSQKRKTTKKLLKTFRSHGRQPDWLERKRSALMVVASLIATMAFQAGVNPPGGVWQDTSDGDSKTKPHTAGFSIMAEYHYVVYGWFLALNTISFVASLSIILLLVSGLPAVKRRFFMWVLMVIMWVAITSIAITYAISITVFTPAEQSITLYKVLGWAVVAWCGLMTLLLIGHTIRLLARLFSGLYRVFLPRRRKVPAKAFRLSSAEAINDVVA